MGTDCKSVAKATQVRILDLPPPREARAPEARAPRVPSVSPAGGTGINAPTEGAHFVTTFMRAGRAGSLRRTPVQAGALILGVVFLVTGIVGFVPGITTHYGAMSLAGH